MLETRMLTYNEDYHLLKKKKLAIQANKQYEQYNASCINRINYSGNI